MLHRYSALVFSAAMAAAAPVAVAEPPTDAPATPPGPAERAGAEVDRALARLNAWMDRAAAKSKQEFGTADAAARRWLAQTSRDLIGDPKARKVHGMQLARRLSDHTLPSGETVIHHDWTDVQTLIAKGGKLPERIVLLLHGLDEPGTGWDDLTPHLLRAGYEVIWFDYPNDGPIAASADIVGAGLIDLRRAGVERIDIIGHSMGGLVARDLATRETWYAGDGLAPQRKDLPRLERLIIMSAPNHGSDLAPLQPLAEAREQISRRLDDAQHPGAGLVHSYTDGAGEAAIDLAPGSKFLADLNARPMPRNVAVTNIIAVLWAEEDRRTVVRHANDLAAWMGVEPSARVERLIVRLGEIVGDGLVSAKSAELEGITDTVRVHADHRSMVRAWSILPEPEEPALTSPRQTPAVPVILERLAREAP